MTQTYKTGIHLLEKGYEPADVCLDNYELNKEKVEMVSAISYPLPALCLRINSSLSMGMARFQISSQDIFVNCSLVRHLSATDFFIAMIGLRFYLGVFGSSSFVQLPSFSGIHYMP